MVGINVPIPVPMAFHSFGGWKRSLFGDHHMHGPEGVRFYAPEGDLALADRHPRRRRVQDADHGLRPPGGSTTENSAARGQARGAASHRRR